ncbi:hypothetical protein D0T53_08075 [Dysgonomonas sp. 216]|uniref:hypothetical protein n=1 Tax=Dysgonomonas sp. 216 TaxID=2302934 RepID=UPI0013D1942F|nr:hypothetical protein [Dysgonomonas sp. 216]NDW18868.1 hypothetical protein [Dysgonomonas sp. 216]
MKKLIIFLSVTILTIVCCLYAQEVEPVQLPSEEVYENTIEAMNINASGELPSTRAGGDDDLDPGGSSEGDGGWVGAPIADNAAAILILSGGYLTFTVLRNRGKKTKNKR